MRRVVVVVVAALMEACGSARVAHVATAHRVASTAVPSRWIVLAAMGAPMRVRHADGLRVAGGYRIEAGRAAEGPASAEVLLAALQGAGDTWRFVGERGVYESRGFAGALREVDRVPEGARAGRGIGRVVGVRDGALLGATGPAGAGRVLDAAFEDGDHGVVVIEPGRAFATGDGGAHWRAIALTDDAARAVLADAHGRWVLGDELAVQIARDGTTREVPLETAPGLDRTDDPRDEADARDAREGDVPARALHDATQWTALDFRTVLAVDRTHVRRFDLEGDQSFDDGETGCAPRALFATDRTYAVCATADGTTQLVARVAPLRWQRVLTTYGTAPDAIACVGSDDGARVACRGRCTAGEPHASHVCERDLARGTLHEHEVGDGWLLGYDAHELVVARASEGATRDVPLASLTLAPANATASTDIVVSDPSTLRLDPDGRVRGEARDVSQGVRGWVEGRPGVGLAFHRPPYGAGAALPGPDAVALAAVGTTLRETHDEGAHWSDVTASGTLAPWLAWSAGAFDRAHCSTDGCTFGDRVVRVGWGPPAPSRASAHGPPPAPTAHGTGELRVRCESDGAAMRVPDLPTMAEATLGAFGDQGTQGTLLVREHVVSQGSGLRVHAAWRTPDASQAVQSSFPLDAYPGATSTRWIAISLGSDRALLARCGAGPGGLARRCIVLRVTDRDVPPAVLGRLPAGELTVVHGDDGVALLATDDAASRAVLMRVPSAGDAQGTPVVLGDGTRGAYRLGDETGIAARRADGTWVLEPADGSPGRALATGDGRAPCAADARGEIVLRGTGSLRDAAGTHEVTLDARFGIAPDATACLRGVDGRVRQFVEPGWLSARAGPDGALIGTARTREGLAPVHCRLERP